MERFVAKPLPKIFVKCWKQIVRGVRQNALVGRLSCMTGILKTPALPSAADGAA